MSLAEALDVSGRAGWKPLLEDPVVVSLSLNSEREDIPFPTGKFPAVCLSAPKSESGSDHPNPAFIVLVLQNVDSKLSIIDIKRDPPRAELSWFFAPVYGRMSREHQRAARSFAGNGCEAIKSGDRRLEFIGGIDYSDKLKLFGQLFPLLGNGDESPGPSQFTEAVISKQHDKLAIVFGPGKARIPFLDKYVRVDAKPVVYKLIERQFANIE